MSRRIADLVRPLNDIETETLDIPQWGGVQIQVRGMDGVHRAEFISRFAEAQNSDEEREMAEVELDLIILCAFDPEDGSPAFDESDRDWLIQKSGAVIGRLSQSAMRVSGIDAKAEERVGKGSSSSTPTDDSSSVSPTN